MNSVNLLTPFNSYIKTQSLKVKKDEMYAELRQLNEGFDSFIGKYVIEENNQERFSHANSSTEEKKLSYDTEKIQGEQQLVGRNDTSREYPKNNKLDRHDDSIVMLSEENSLSKSEEKFSDVRSKNRELLFVRHQDRLYKYVNLDGDMKARDLQDLKKIKVDNLNISSGIVSFLLNIINIQSKSDLPQDVRERIENIKTKLNSGKVNLNEISVLIIELQKLISNHKSLDVRHASNNLNLTFEALSEYISALKNVKKDITYSHFNQDKIPEDVNIIVKDFRSQVARREDLKSSINDSLLQTPFKIETRFTPHQVQQPFQTLFQPYVQLQMLSNSIQEFSGKMIINLRNNINEMKMTLFPPDLGKVFVKVETNSDGKISGSIVVSTKEAYTLFQEYLNVIKENLVNQGFQVGNMNVVLDNGLYGGTSSYKDNEAILDNEKFFNAFKKASNEYEDASSPLRISDYDGKIIIYA
ncbi:MAG: flagellar hook-length control protein FliK [Brevinematales bacterium]|nr:flagellar hook-length control protein FliK [Brevinematales bacterium]